MIKEEQILLRGSQLAGLSRAVRIEARDPGWLDAEAVRVSNLVEQLVSTGETYLENKQFADALDCFESALYLHPENRRARQGRNQAHCTIIPRWHFEMLNDENRNAAFEKALARAVAPDTIVLDIGSGTGLLAMMAGRAGAKEVYSCEMVSPLAELARQTVRRNGLADRIHIFDRKSTAVSVGAQMPHRANLLVTETVDCGLLGEGIVPSIEHARANLLTEDARIIPRAASVHAVVAESPRLRNLNRVRTAADFDVSLIMQFATAGYFPVRLAAFDYKPLTEPFQVFSFDFVGDPIRPARKVVKVPAARAGVAQTIIFWFDMQLDEEISINNAPGSVTHWEQAVQCLEAETAVRVGETLGVEVEHDCSAVSFRLLDDA